MDEQGADEQGVGERVGSTGAFGCLVAVLAAAVAFGVWRHGAGPGLRGSFEGERDWRLLYADLPAMLFGIPALTAGARWLTGSLVSRRAGAVTRAVVSTAAASVTLAVLAWAGLMWLDDRVSPFGEPR